MEKERLEDYFYAIRAAYIINKNYGQNFVTGDFRRKNRKLLVFGEVVEEVANNTVQSKCLHRHIFRWNGL